MAINSSGGNDPRRGIGLGMKGIMLVSLALSAVIPGLFWYHHESDQSNSSENYSAFVSYPAAVKASGAYEGLIYGRVSTEDGTTYEGRLRWGGNEEAHWSDYFNGFKDENPWAAHVRPEQLKKRHSVEIFGIELWDWKSELELGRPFMVRFGDIARIEPRGRDIYVTLRSGSVFVLDRFAADDLADGVRVWDTRRGVVDLDEWSIRLIEFLPTAHLENAPARLHGTVDTRLGKFTGFIQWNREEGVASDELEGRTPEGENRFPFDTIRSIERISSDASLVTFVDGRELVLTGTSEVGHGNRGVYVDDRRYGRVLVSWDAFERIIFSPGGSGPAFRDFAPGLPLAGSVITRAGNRLIGRLVYDLDESETTETLDAPYDGVDFTIPFARVASIEPLANQESFAGKARVTLWSGEELLLEHSGDLGHGNAGILVFIDNRALPEYLVWTDIERIDFERSPTASAPPGDN